ncbi:MAG: hypothetical protein V3R52_07435 [Candidatus Neomarinimicrobiota bacterium]
MINNLIMAKVNAPFFSSFATGSLGKTITVRACFSNNKFVMAMHKTRSGKRHAIQIFNANAFRERHRAVSNLPEV